MVQQTELFSKRDLGEKEIYIIDLSSYIFRAFFAIKYLSNSKGFPTNAIFGVTKMLINLYNDKKPVYWVVALDSKPPNFRHDLYPQYKANRPPPPEDLIVQIPYINQLVSLLNIPSVAVKGFEADDIIASIAKKAENEGFKVIIVSGDKDLMQLVDNKVVLYDSLKEEIYTPDKVEKKFGVPPTQIRDFLTLVGDSSDNVPGVRGVGPKTAKDLLKKYGTVESIIKDADNIKKVGEEFIKNKENCLLSQKLVTLVDNLEVPGWENLKYKEPQKEQLITFLKEFEFSSIMKDLGLENIGISGYEEKIEINFAKDYKLVTSEEELIKIENEIYQKKEFALDLETSSLMPYESKIVGISLSCDKDRGWYIPVNHINSTVKQISWDKVRQFVLSIGNKEDLKIFGHNFKFDYEILKVNKTEIKFASFDTMLASYLIDPERHQHRLEQISAEYLKYKMITYDEVTQKERGKQLNFAEVTPESACRYSAEDAEITFSLSNILKDKLVSEKLDKILFEIELPLSRVLADMEIIGIKVDKKLLNDLSVDIDAELKQLESKAFGIAGFDFNLNSPKQLQEILFGKFQLPQIKKTKTGSSTDVEVLEELSYIHPLPETILQHRKLSKLKNTYAEALPKLICPVTGRIHTSYNQAVTATGRLSSSEPNLQNIPIRTDIGKKIREAFIVPEDKIMLSADYSQIELRVLAHLSKDPILIEAFNNGEDIHSRTAREIFEINEDKVPEELRRRAKAINFGVIYGKTVFGLSKELGIPRSDASKFINNYFSRYSSITTYFDSLIEQAKKTQEVRTMFGRRRIISGINSKNHNIMNMAERMAKNTSLQGSAADILKIAMISIYDELNKTGLKTKMVLTVHDELIFEVPISEKEEAKKIVIDKMSNVIKLLVPLTVDTGWGKSWAEAH